MRLRKIDPEMTIGEFIKKFNHRLGKKSFVPDEIEADHNQMCCKAVRWLMKMGSDQPIRIAWERCSRPMWLAWALVIFSDGEFQMFDDGIGPRYIIWKRLYDLGIVEDSDFWFDDDNLDKSKADLIRKHFQPFIKEA